jgi:hypothetical protein
MQQDARRRLVGEYRFGTEKDGAKTRLCQLLSSGRYVVILTARCALVSCLGECRYKHIK